MYGAGSLNKLLNNSPAAFLLGRLFEESVYCILGGAEFRTQKCLLATQEPVDKCPCIIHQNKGNGLQFIVYRVKLHIIHTGETKLFQKVPT